MTTITNFASSGPIGLRICSSCGFLPEIAYTTFQMSSLNGEKVINMCIYPLKLKIDRVCVGQILLLYNICLCSIASLIFLSKFIKKKRFSICWPVKGQFLFLAALSSSRSPGVCRSVGRSVRPSVGRSGYVCEKVTFRESSE